MATHKQYERPGLCLEEIDFLQQSNYIENVIDSDSLDKAVEAWYYMKSLSKIEPSNIKRMHKILMEGKLPKHQLGHYRSVPVFVGGREGYPAAELTHHVREWTIRANQPMTEEEIKEHHVLYEKIHPFFDGNGRTGRILMNWQRIKNGLPVLVIWEPDKQDYYDWFRSDEEKRAIRDRKQAMLYRIFTELEREKERLKT